MVDAVECKNCKAVFEAVYEHAIKDENNKPIPNFWGCPYCRTRFDEQPHTLWTRDGLHGPTKDFEVNTSTATKNRMGADTQVFVPRPETDNIWTRLGRAAKWRTSQKSAKEKLQRWDRNRPYDRMADSYEIQQRRQERIADEFGSDLMGMAPESEPINITIKDIHRQIKAFDSAVSELKKLNKELAEHYLREFTGARKTSGLRSSEIQFIRMNPLDKSEVDDRQYLFFEKLNRLTKSVNYETRRLLEAAAQNRGINSGRDPNKESSWNFKENGKQGLKDSIDMMGTVDLPGDPEKAEEIEEEIEEIEKEEQETPIKTAAYACVGACGMIPLYFYTASNNFGVPKEYFVVVAAFIGIIGVWNASQEWRNKKHTGEKEHGGSGGFFSKFKKSKEPQEAGEEDSEEEKS
ncbi:MAG: hypothetical protein KAT91_01115 [Candidatus Aenigmarchaeota archaeon]|nr:hypothetical protein [Candidatus Aenigmarchaeota archaeon]